jgi:hypothetical protein
MALTSLVQGTMIMTSCSLAALAAANGMHTIMQPAMPRTKEPGVLALSSLVLPA